MRLYDEDLHGVAAIMSGQLPKLSREICFPSIYTVTMLS